MDLPQPLGIVSNTQRFSLHDGPGIRTTVFLKGCPLHCAWCANPESMRPEPELVLRVAICIGCGKCGAVCPRGAITYPEGRCWIDRTACDSCMHCAAVCPSKALEKVGALMTVGQVMDVVLRDAGYYRRTGGGLTLSGGEPLLQPRFAEALLCEASRRGVHTAVDTSGHAAWDDMQAILLHTDLVLYDLKHPDADAHRQGTGLSNDRIFENLERILAWTNARVWVRIPVIPGFNDSDEVITEVCRRLRFLPRPIEKLSLLPFHNLGAAKHGACGRGYECNGLPLPTLERVVACRELVEQNGFDAEIGR